MPLNVTTVEGKRLKDEYQVGTTYPVYILTDQKGDIIARWTGYTGGAKAFVNTLNAKLRDLTTVNAREKRFKTTPTFDDAVILARYYTDIYDNLKAIDYFRQAEKLKSIKAYDFSFDIFKNMANAAWVDQMPFDSVLPAADVALSNPTKNLSNTIKVGQMMARLACKLGKNNRIAKYLNTCIDASAGSAQFGEMHELLKADYALQILNDTAKAVSIKKATMGPNWMNERDRFYEFSRWCLEREINLEEAELYARRAVDLVYPGKYRAKVLNTVAEICYARGNKTEAVKMIKLAVEQEPENEFYQTQQEKFSNSLSK
ncbi:MAG: hypothetical protein AB1746_12725 [Candidatus Zixiibacteriota bacterium]